MRIMIGTALLCTSILLAQDGAEKVRVPLSDPSRPPRIQVHLLSGSISVRGADIKDVLVETHSRGHFEPSRPRSPESGGMRRLELPTNMGLDIVEDNDVVNIKGGPWNRVGDLVITVPRRSSLQLKSFNNGDITVEQVEGEIDTNDLNGKITLKNVAGSVLAHSLNGEVIAMLDRVDPAKPMSFSTLNGKIDVTLPQDVRANVNIRTDNGEIYSDFDVKLDGKARLLQEEPGRRDTTHHLRYDQAVHGTINGGGPDFQFTSFNGQIYIRKGK